MPRPLCIWLPTLAVLALSACGGAESGLFSDVGGSGSGGSSRAGGPSLAGANSISGFGQGGNASNAGNPSAGGDSSSAGMPGSGGRADAGSSNGGSQSGGAGSGGRAGANNGGGSASGGRAGAGGSVGSAGQGGAQAGSAGTGGTSQALTCSELLKKASQQLEEARVCSVAANARQCTGTVMNQCNCEVSVQRVDSAETKAYLDTLKQLQKKNCAIACTTLLCKPVSDGECKQSGSSTAGLCVGVSYGFGPGPGP